MMMRIWRNISRMVNTQKTSVTKINLRCFHGTHKPMDANILVKTPIYLRVRQWRRRRRDQEAARWGAVTHKTSKWLEVAFYVTSCSTLGRWHSVVVFSAYVTTISIVVGTWRWFQVRKQIQNVMKHLIQTYHWPNDQTQDWTSNASLWQPHIVECSQFWCYFVW